MLAGEVQWAWKIVKEFDFIWVAKLFGQLRRSGIQTHALRSYDRLTQKKNQNKNVC